MEHQILTQLIFVKNVLSVHSVKYIVPVLPVLIFIPCYFSQIFPGYYCIHVNSLVNDFTEVVDRER